MTRIDTVDQLDALPIGSVILDNEGDAWQRRHFMTRWEIASHGACNLRFIAEDPPAILLHVPADNPYLPKEPA